MVKKAEVLAIVPARAGSKSIPKKNVRLFAGHPLLAYSIAAGLQADCVSRLIVSTDDEGFADIARNYGAEVPFLRPAELAADEVTDLPVFEHVLNWLREEENYRPDVVVQLRPTSPIRPRDCVDRAVGLLLDNPRARCHSHRDHTREEIDERGYDLAAAARSEVHRRHRHARRLAAGGIHLDARRSRSGFPRP
ncbi:MAG: acylneuraminate cytidylyltransferase family protein [Anaerolineales bacterium]